MLFLLIGPGVHVRIHNLNAQHPHHDKNHEYGLLDAIAQDALVTQASLSSHLGMAVGSVNWYIKRLINCAYIKVSRLDRTRLKYQLTPESLSIVT